VAGHARPLGITPPAEEVLIQKVVSIEPVSTPGTGLPGTEKALAGLGARRLRMIVHLAYDDDEMRGATFDHQTGAAWPSTTSNGSDSDSEIPKRPGIRAGGLEGSREGAAERLRKSGGL